MLKSKDFVRLSFATLMLAFLASGTLVFGQDFGGDGVQEKFQKGRELIDEKKFAEAAKVFKEITEANEELGAGWFMLGYALHSDGQLDKAIKMHKKAAEFDEFAAIATYNLGCAFALKHDSDGALEALEKAVDIGFDDLDQFEIDADLLSLHTNVRFAKILAGLAGDEKIVEKLDEAEGLLGEQDFAKAAEMYRAIVKEDADNAFATYRLGYSLHGAGDLDEALEMHTKATKFDGVAPVATYNIGCVHSLQGNKDEAFKYLTKAVDIGFVRLDAYERDPDLENIRDDERFVKLVSKIKEKHEHSHEKEHKEKRDHDGEHDGEHKDKNSEHDDG